MYFLALLIEGVSAGAIYALIALAFVLVYRASGMMNFALGEWVVFGAVLAGTGLHFLQLGTVGALIFAALGMIALGDQADTSADLQRLRRQRGGGQRHERVHDVVVPLGQVTAQDEARFARLRDVRVLGRPDDVEAALLQRDRERRRTH